MTPQRRAKAALSALLAPLLALSPLFSAFPAAAQPEVIESVETAVRAPASAPSAPLSLRADVPALPADAIENLSAAALATPQAAAAVQTASLARTAQAAPRTLFGRLADVVKAGFSLPSQIGALYEGRPAYAVGILTAPQSAPVLRAGVNLDVKPQPSDIGAVRTKRFHLSRDHTLDDGSRPIELDADPADPASVEKALRELVDSDPKKYGASSADMAKVHVQLVRGSKEQNQADTYYAVFRQWKKGVDRDGRPYFLAVDGGNLAFVIKVFADGKPVIMATEGRLFPDVDSDLMTPSYDDDQLQTIAENRLHAPAKSKTSKAKRALAKAWAAAKRSVRASKETKPELLTREITNVEGTWRAVNVYQASDLKGRPVIVAVDVKTGESFAWSAQELIRGETLGRGTTLTKEGTDHGPVDAMPLPFANLVNENDEVVATADENGRFSLPDGGSPFKLKVRLDGRYAKVFDESSKDKPLEASATVSKEPRTARLVINAVGSDANNLADVNGYVYYSRQLDWLTGPGGVDDARVKTPLAGGVRTNKKDMPGNAYFSPTNDGLNLEAEAIVKMRDEEGKVHTIHFEGTDKASIVYHESTHRAVQIMSQIELTAAQKADKAYRFVAKLIEPIMDGGVNEAIADTVSMFMRGSPIIGDGYIIDPEDGMPSFIRTGENKTKFDPKNPDPHAQGEAFMGFTWSIRQVLIAALGEAAGAAYAALMVVPTTLYSQPQDVPTAMLHVLLGSMTRDGRLPHEAIIRKPAAEHGVDIPEITPTRRPSS